LISANITEHRNLIEGLKSSEERLRILFEFAPDGYYLNDLKGTFIDGNKAAEKITGYTRTELIGKSFLKLKLLPRSQILKAAKLLALNAAGKSTGPDELVLNRKDGTQVPMEIRTHPVRINGQTLVLGIARDITERKKAAEALSESEKRFRTVFEGASEGIVAADMRSRHFVFANPAMCELTGYSLKELLKLGVNDIHLKEDLPYVIGEFTKQAEGKTILAKDIPVLRKDNKVVYCEVSSRTLPFGKKEYLVGFFRDVSERKKAEDEVRETMEKLEVVNEKLRVVGDLARHDVRNKLTAVTGYTYLARNKLPGNSEVLDYLKQIEASIEQTVRIFDFAKTYEALGVEELVYIDVEKTVNEAASLFPHLKDIKVMNECHDLIVLADSLLRTLFYNLIDNSLKYGEKLSLIRVYYKEENGDHLNLIYEDDGVGIPQAAKPKLFDKGYTTGKGSGYGLYLIKRMMEVYGWTIQETGTPSKGAQFTITIPKTNPNGKENYRLDRKR
jgi:PAS domain S-box-containing protein